VVVLSRPWWWAAQRLARYTSPTRRAESQLSELMGGSKVDRLGLFMSARSQQLARRKFLCEIDGRGVTPLHLSPQPQLHLTP
jgi:hypothetical protein